MVKMPLDPKAAKLLSGGGCSLQPAAVPCCGHPSPPKSSIPSKGLQGTGWVIKNIDFSCSRQLAPGARTQLNLWEYLHFSKKISQNFLKFLFFQFFPPCLNERQKYLRLTAPLLEWLCCTSCWMLLSRDSERHYLSLKSKNSPHFLFFCFHYSVKISTSFRTD